MLLRKILPRAFSNHQTHFRSLLPFSDAFFSTSTAIATNSAAKLPPLMLGYLVGNCGFSPEEAAKASKCLSHIKSPRKADAVLSFFRGKGFDADQIKRLVSSRPSLLCASVDQTLEPKFNAFEAMGCSNSDLLRLFLGNNALLNTSLGKKLVPNISLLEESGVPRHRIPRFIRRSRWLISWHEDSLRALIRRTEELGFVPGSSMFEYGLNAVSTQSRSNLEAKLKHLQSLGWTEEEMLSAICKAPNLLLCSRDKVRKSMDFLVGEVGYEPAYVARYPILLMLSLGKRLVPRHRVLRILESEGLIKRARSFLTVTRLSEKVFLDRYVHKHEERIPGLNDAYVATKLTMEVACM